MEEQSTQPASPMVNQGSGVSFPSTNPQPAPKKSGGKTFLVLGILILVLILGFIIFKNGSGDEDTKSEPTPYSDSMMEDTTEATPEPTSTPKAVNKEDIKINIQNGTGIAGEAAYLQTQLKTLGFTNITAGNASSQDEKVTTVTFSKSLDQTIVDEVTKKLKDLYQEVTVKTSSTATTDIVVVTGLKKGSTSKASSTPAATSTAKASASPTPTATSSN